MIATLLSGCVVFLTHAIEAVTGFGCTVLALPFVTALLGTKTGVVVLAVLAWLLAAYMVVTKRRHLNLKEYGIIVLFVGFGLPVGMYLFKTLDAALMKKILAVFILLVSAYQLGRGFFTSRKGPAFSSPVPYYALLVLGGIVHGAFASGGPLVVVYAARALKDKGEFRATLCLLWTTLNTVLLISFALNGLLNAETLGIIGLMLPFLGAGIYAGEKVHDKVNAEVFTKVVFGVLFASGLVMLAI